MREDVQYISFLLPLFLVQFTKYLFWVCLSHLGWRSHICQMNMIPHGSDTFGVNLVFSEVFQLCLQHKFVPKAPFVASHRVLLGNCFRSHASLLDGQLDQMYPS